MPLHKRPWFRDVVQLRGSVIPAILPRTIFCGLFGLMISILFYQGAPVNIPALASIIPNIVLGLLLVFRTNTAYERFWEGRRIWGTLTNTIRNLARQMWVIILEKDLQDRDEKQDAMRLLVAFAVAMKLKLRDEPINTNELESLISSARYSTLKTMNNPPLEIAFWISRYLQEQFHRDRVSMYQLNSMQELVNTMVDCLGGCERILKTPIPFAYAIHLKQLLLLYCLFLPFQLVADLGWWTGIVAALISFTLFGIEEIGIEIENPFGRDANDLPLDTICHVMLLNLEDLMSLDPKTIHHFSVSTAEDA
jgi:ion channel-forming bestrophin family protein